MELRTCTPAICFWSTIPTGRPVTSTTSFWFPLSFIRVNYWGYVSNTCHHVDVGGGAPASIGAFREIYQEGIILPVVKLLCGDQIDADIWKMLLANVRAKREVAGDLRAQISANNMGMRRLSALVERYGIEKLDFYIQRLLEYTEERTRSELKKLPRGEL